MDCSDGRTVEKWSLFRHGRHHYNEPLCWWGKAALDDFQHALDLDVRQELEAAAHAYERVIAQPNAPLDAYLNLACLYWRCIDFEFTWSLSLEIAFIWRAGERVWQVLDAAEAVYPQFPEIRFWRAYFRLTTLDQPPFVEACGTLVEQPNATLVPYFYLYSATQDSGYREQARMLYCEAQATLTTKNRYIVSVLEPFFSA